MTSEPVVGFRVSPYNWRLRKRRLALGMTLADLADAAGYSSSSVGNIERLVAKPSSRCAQRLADVLHADPDELFPEILGELHLASRTLEIGLDQDQVRELAADSALSAAERNIDLGELRVTLASALGALKPRDRHVLEARFGLDGDGPKTLEEVAQRVGLGSSERVRQIEARALRRLRLPTISRHLLPYVDGAHHYDRLPAPREKPRGVEQ